VGWVSFWRDREDLELWRIGGRPSLAQAGGVRR
jgi:hypothetical protein